MRVPVVDLSALAPGDPVVGAALAASGFAVMEGHGVPAALWQRAYRAATGAFALPAATKARYRGPEDGSQRGYLPLRTALSAGRPALDRKEAWHVRRAGHRFANILPDEVPDLGPAALALVEALEGLAERVLGSIDAFLGRPPGSFAAAVRGSDSLFRFNHYPDLPEDAPPVRFRAHQDFDLATLLLGATRPGLEVQARDGTWHPVTPSPDGIVLNAGDILAVDSGGRIPSTPHRVMRPDRPDGGRLSMVYFVSPRVDVRMASGDTVGRFLDARLRDAGYLR